MKAITYLVAAICVMSLATNSWAASNLNLSKSNINRGDVSMEVGT